MGMHFSSFTWRISEQSGLFGWDIIVGEFMILSIMIWLWKLSMRPQMDLGGLQKPMAFTDACFSKKTKLKNRKKTNKGEDWLWRDMLWYHWYLQFFPASVTKWCNQMSKAAKDHLTSVEDHGETRMWSSERYNRIYWYDQKHGVIKYKTGSFWSRFDYKFSMNGKC